MKMSFFITGLLFALISTAQTGIYKTGWIDLNKNGKKDVYEDPKQSIDKRIDDLLSKMTLEEKSCQMATLYGYGRVLKDEMPTKGWKDSIWKDGIANIDEELNSLPNNEKAKSQYSFPFSKHANAINTIQKWFIEETRLGIPVDFTNEGIHGLCHDRATSLPAPISIGSTWNKQLVKLSGETVGREAKALGYTNIYAPILDPARDPRWGRVVECYGEDPFLIAELGKQMVLGIQSKGVAATLKHFAVYSIPKGGRDGNARTDPHVAPKEMHQLYLYPFRRVIEEAKPWGVMSSYNDWDGDPVTGSSYFLTDLLRKQYGFKGYVVSDSRAVEFLYSKHHVATDFKDATRLAVEAGLNVWTNFDPPNKYIINVRELVKEGKLSIQTVNARVRDVLRVKFALGLFDNPFVKDPDESDRVVHTKADEDMALQLNRESLVLLKNKDALLPLNKNAGKRILVTGPLAAATSYAISRYGPSNNKVTSILEGIRSIGGNNIIDHAMGCTVVNEGWPETEIIPSPLTASEQAGIDSAVAKAKQSDIIIAVLGEDEKCVGESLSRTSLDLPGRQQQLLEALYATGKPVVLVLINGQPLTINWADRYIPSILEAWFPGPESGRVVAETLFGDYNPGGKLPITFPKTTGQLELNFPFKPGSHASQSSKEDPNGYGKTSVNGPLYPFGHGLSYTGFTYSNLIVTPTVQTAKATIAVSMDITNTGIRAGDEVVQLYIKDKMSSVTVYEMQLRGFERIHLQPGEKKTIHFTIEPSHLALLNKDMKMVIEPGEFEILIGSSSVDIRLKKTFTIK
ncbi:MAG TPA: glycoside hydrolase family 3 N-terminal domain-containing protein [Chitinophagaceae bacterium]|jgi:beta-glucosidase|nr:glycoside hydrolase family 3 N-terminal domain-containing protein [Chitinophagaceae bacterium]